MYVFSFDSLVLKDWRSLTIYQLLTDRFADGDPRNNELHSGGFDIRDMTYRPGVWCKSWAFLPMPACRHGGDFVGLKNKLPYIKGLGCEARDA